MNLAQSFLTNSPWLGVMSFILAAVLAALICYFVARILLGSRIAEDSELLAGRIMARLGTLHALILALMFAQEMTDYRDIFRIVTKEASAIGNVYTALQEYDEENPKATVAISDRIVDYVRVSSEVERAALFEAHPSHRIRIDYQRISRQLRDLQPANDDQEDIRAQMLDDWASVSNFHQQLEASVEYEFPDFFWVVIITGFLAIVVPCYVYSPKITNLVTLSTFAAVNGLVMYVIFAIENPFTGPVAIDSHVLENLLAMMGNTAR